MTSSGGLVVLDSTVTSFLMRDRGLAGSYRLAIAGLTRKKMGRVKAN